MADDKTDKFSDLDNLAFEIFSKRAASGVVRGEQDAVLSYRQAETFLKVRAAVGKGGLKAAPADSPLADCRAPNQKRTHPHNLVAQNGGDLQRVARIKKWLDANPTPEREPDELLANLSREFPDLGWDLPTVNVARAIFPAFAKN